MNNYFLNLKDRAESLRSRGTHDPRLVFYGAALGLLKFAIILTRGSGFAFPLLYQHKGARSTEYPYRDFKRYQRKIRFIFVLAVILAVILISVYLNI